jgi:hypothetical protein
MRCYRQIVDSATCETRFGEAIMIEYLSPTVLAAVLRASSTPIFSIHLALASLLTPREAPGSAANIANTADRQAASRTTPRLEDTNRV